MNKIILITALLTLQSCASMSNPKTPDEYVERTKASRFGRVNIITIEKPIKKVLTDLTTPLNACYHGTSVSWQHNTMVGGSNWKVSVEEKEKGLKQFAILSKEKGLVIGEPENGLINAVIQVRPISTSKTEVTEYHTIGNDKFGEMLLSWAQGKKAECPL